MGSTLQTFNGGPIGRFNAYSCSEDHVLKRIEVALALSATRQLQYVVYEADASAGPYNRIYASKQVSNLSRWWH